MSQTIAQCEIVFIRCYDIFMDKNNDLNRIKISQAQINAVKLWIVKNKEILIDYWEEKITTDELFQKLKKQVYLIIELKSPI